jgi:hypothetical protein
MTDRKTLSTQLVPADTGTDSFSQPATIEDVQIAGVETSGKTDSGCAVTTDDNSESSLGHSVPETANTSPSMDALKSNPSVYLPYLEGLELPDLHNYAVCGENTGSGELAKIARRLIKDKSASILKLAKNLGSRSYELSATLFVYKDLQIFRIETGDDKEWAAFLDNELNMSTSYAKKLIGFYHFRRDLEKEGIDKFLEAQGVGDRKEHFVPANQGQIRKATGLKTSKAKMNFWEKVVKETIKRNAPRVSESIVAAVVKAENNGKNTGAGKNKPTGAKKTLLDKFSEKVVMETDFSSAGRAFGNVFHELSKLWDADSKQLALSGVVEKMEADDIVVGLFKAFEQDQTKLTDIAKNLSRYSDHG